MNVYIYVINILQSIHDYYEKSKIWQNQNHLLLLQHFCMWIHILCGVVHKFECKLHSAVLRVLCALPRPSIQAVCIDMLQLFAKTSLKINRRLNGDYTAVPAVVVDATAAAISASNTFVHTFQWIEHRICCIGCLLAAHFPNAR